MRSRVGITIWLRRRGWSREWEGYGDFMSLCLDADMVLRVHSCGIQGMIHSCLELTSKQED